MGFWDDVGTKAKDAGKFIADSAKEAKDAVSEAWPSEEINDIGNDIKQKSSEIADKTSDKLKIAKESIDETSDKFVEKMVYAKDEYVKSWDSLVQEINPNSIENSRRISEAVRRLDLEMFDKHGDGVVFYYKDGKLTYLSPTTSSRTDYLNYEMHKNGIYDGIFGDQQVFYEFDFSSIEDTFAVASYYTAVKMTVNEGVMDEVSSYISEELHDIYSDSRFTNLLAKEFGVSEESVSDVIDSLVEETFETAKSVRYINYRISIGAAQVTENAIKGVVTTYEKAIGNDEKANSIMESSYTETVKKIADELYQRDDTVKTIGDIAEDVSEGVTECGLAVAALSTGVGEVSAVAAAGSAALLSANNAGKSLEKNYEKQGEVTDDAVIAATATAAATIVATEVGSAVNNKIASSIPKVANKIARAENITEKVGGRITGTLVNAAYGANIGSAMSIPEKVGKVVNVGLGIDENINVKEEVKDYVTTVAGGAAIAGATYYFSSLIKDTKAFESVMKTIKGKDFVVKPDQYEKAFLKERIKIENSEKLLTSSAERIAQAKKSKGCWNGAIGDSNFVPDSEEAAQALKQYGQESIEYIDGNPDFKNVSESTVEIENMTSKRPKNFSQADELCAQKWNAESRGGKTNWSARDVKNWRQQNKYTWHERVDRTTMDLVQRDIHEACKHYGGVAECKRFEALLK